MRLDKLQLDLHPRPHWQALDMGHILLRQHAALAYRVWLALWLPLCLLSAAAMYFWPTMAAYVLWLPWWLRPLLERALIFVYSRAVFGEQIHWQQALRKWPTQLGGGWFRLLTWWRIFMPGRGLYQCIWQLEGARGATASNRIRVLGREGAASAAYWFGIVCAHFEAVLLFGVIGFLGFILSDSDAMNPLALFFKSDWRSENTLLLIQAFAMAFTGAIIAPLYVASEFCLYLNRRAELEAWDTEIAFKQMIDKRQQPKSAPSVASVSVVMLILMTSLGFISLSSQVQANEVPMDEVCETPKWFETRDRHLSWKQDNGDAEQKQWRARLQSLYDDVDLRGYECREIWRPKFKMDDKKTRPWGLPFWVADLIKLLLLLSVVTLLIYLLIRFQQPLLRIFRIQVRKNAAPPDAIVGLDIRPESLPADVIKEVHQLWQSAQRRAALALLYRATLSRLAYQAGVKFSSSATEGDCLRQAYRAQQRHELSEENVQLLQMVTALWSEIAYANRSPSATRVQEQCLRWQQLLGATS